MLELLKILMSLSLSGTLLILVLIICKPLYKNRLSRQWQYYIWLVVVARILLPLTLETSIIGNIFNKVDSAIVQISTSEQINKYISHETEFAEDGILPRNQDDTTTRESAELEKTFLQKIFEIASQNIWLICVLVWLIVAIGLLIRKITIYQSFVKYINAGRMEATDMRLWEYLGKLVEQAGVKRTVELYTNSLISSPLLIGFLHPCIMLPSVELSDSDLNNTILHELTHYKRRDMFYKWLVQVTVCFHWFNPFVYLMCKEINRACELSCDEAVIRTFDTGAQRAYGDTLLNAIGTGGNYNDSLASIMLNENAELLKERLDAIMRFKKSTRLTSAISIALVFTLCFGATATGAYTKPKQLSKDNINIKDSITIDNSNIVENNDKKIIDIASVKSFRVTAGSGPEQALDYSKLKQTYFSFSQGQKLKVDVDFISAFHTSTSGHSVKLIFVDSQQHTVELILNEGEKSEIIFENAGVYSLSIQNDENISLGYSFILQESKILSISNDTKVVESQSYNISQETGVVIEQVNPILNNGKSGLEVSFSNTSDKIIQSIYIRLKFPDSGGSTGINSDFNTKGDNSWSLEANGECSYFWPFSHNNDGLFKIAITSYTTMDGKLHSISEKNWKWFEFYYPGKNDITNSGDSRELFTSNINESLYGKRFYVMNLTAGDLFTAHLSWEGNGTVYIAYVDGIGFQTDKDEDIPLSQFSNDYADYFIYEIPNNEKVTFTVPKDGLYVLPVRDKSDGKIATNIVGEATYYVN